MSVKVIEIIPWVKFNKPGVKEELEKLSSSCTSKMDFLSHVKISTNYLLQMQRQ